MIYTVTCNPAIDYVISLEQCVPGTIHRYQSSTYGPGGKGVNVSLLLTSLGVRNAALGIAAGFSGHEAVRLLEEAGCATDFLFLEQGHSRINVKVCTPGGEETDFNGEGPQTSPQEFEAFLEKLSGLSAGDTLVLAGSIPASLPADVYARIMALLAPKGVEFVVDATGNTLLEALAYRPFLIKPNHEELGELFGLEITDAQGAKACAKLLQDKGARNVVVSMGSAGALLVEEGGNALFCHSVKGETVSTVGAGDSLVAGFLYGYGLHGTLEGALSWGVAAGGATAFSKGIASGEQVKALYAKVSKPHPL